MAVTGSPAALWALYKVHILALDHYSYLRYHVYCLTLYPILQPGKNSCFS